MDLDVPPLASDFFRFSQLPHPNPNPNLKSRSQSEDKVERRPQPNLAKKILATRARFASIGLFWTQNCAREAILIAKPNPNPFTARVTAILLQCGFCGITHQGCIFKSRE